MKHNKNLIRINRGEKMRLKNTLILITLLLIAISMISAVSAANEKVHVGPGDKFNHYPHDSIQHKTGYTFNIELKNGSVYYVTTSSENNIGKLNPLFHLALNHKVSKYFSDNVATKSNILGQKISSEYGADDFFSVPVENEFYITYIQGEPIGENSDIKKVDKVFDKDGNEL